MYKKADTINQLKQLANNSGRDNSNPAAVLEPVIGDEITYALVGLHVYGEVVGFSTTGRSVIVLTQNNVKFKLAKQLCTVVKPVESRLAAMEQFGNIYGKN